MDNEVKEPKASDAQSNQDIETSPAYTIRSRVSPSSVSSSASLAVAKACAKAEAAKAKLEFLDKETDIQLQKTKIEASLRALSLQREVKAANAEAAVLEAAAADMGAEQYREPSEYIALTKHTPTRTEDYVKEQVILRQSVCPQG